MKKRKAFTLIELLIVVAIIAILAVIIVLNLVSAREKANYAKVKDELKTMSDAARIGYTDGVVTAQTSWAVTDSTFLPKIKDSGGANLITSVPIPPSGFGIVSGATSYYQYYLKSSTDFGFRSYDKEYGTAKYCGYLNGAIYTAGSKVAGGDTKIYSACNGS